MQAVLTLYLVQHLGVSDVTANLTIAAFVGLTYITPVLGGVVGDKLLGTRRTMIIGALALALGYAALAFADHHRQFLYFSMALISAGNGLYKPNAGNLVRRIYEGDDAALDAAFTIYYMSINIGSAVSMLLTPYLQERYGSVTAFLTCSVGLMMGLGFYLWRRRWIEAAGNYLDRASFPVKMFTLVVLGFAGVVMLLTYIIGHPDVARLGVWLASLAIVIICVKLYRHATPRERLGLKLTYLLCFQGMAYNIFYQQMMTSLTLFALRAVDGDLRLGGVTLFHMSAGQFQALNPIWVMLASPFLAFFTQRRAAVGRDFSLAQKMIIGFVMVTLGFLVWWLAALRPEPVSAWVMILGYGLISVAELFTLALGLAVIARYTPKDRSGLMMGAAYMLWGIAMYCGSVVANYAAVPTSDLTHFGAHAAGLPYAPLFRDLFLAGCALIALFVCLLPLAARWDRGFAAQEALQ